MIPVTLKIRSLQSSLDGTAERDEISQTIDAMAYKTEDGLELRYDEAEEYGLGATQTILLIRDDDLSMRREGDQELEMFFSLDETCDLIYNTPYGGFPLQIATRELSYGERSLEEGSLHLVYELQLGGNDQMKQCLNIQWFATDQHKGECP